ncbi:hypothetical protein OE88DRAFT_1644923 [Heliocybe sulcata]|uniref:Ribonuclease H1 N-terminal domain-containing protein n=1 Tax=Heliocybe sulcata TaxID=5364 RepID=A0A5C3NC67_9AGAM|nr:hypothetical protein OE88DRAFT_1644923 [Heliocybe sulcata]
MSDIPTVFINHGHWSICVDFAIRSSSYSNRPSQTELEALSMPPDTTLTLRVPEKVPLLSHRPTPIPTMFPNGIIGDTFTVPERIRIRSRHMHAVYDIRVHGSPHSTPELSAPPTAHTIRGPRPIRPLPAIPQGAAIRPEISHFRRASEEHTEHLLDSGSIVKKEIELGQPPDEGKVVTAPTQSPHPPGRVNSGRSTPTPWIRDSGGWNGSVTTKMVSEQESVGAGAQRVSTDIAGSRAVRTSKKVYPWYTVTRGFEVGVFSDWHEVHELVDRCPSNNYLGHADIASVTAYFERAKAKGEVEIVDRALWTQLGASRSAKVKARSWKPALGKKMGGAMPED